MVERSLTQAEIDRDREHHRVAAERQANAGAQQEDKYREQIPLGDQDAAVKFEVKTGRRNEPLAEIQLANAAKGQMQINQAILAQQINSYSAGGANTAFGTSRNGLAGFPFVNGAVGFQPVIITLPAGANFTATGVISADRRYARITALPLFSQITAVSTFNIGSGRSSTLPPPPAGGGGVGGAGT